MSIPRKLRSVFIIPNLKSIIRRKPGSMRRADIFKLIANPKRMVEIES
jgi:hypothetical protein